MNAMRRWAAALACVLALGAQHAAAAASAVFAYVASFETNTVSVIDTATHSVVATVPVGAGPFGVTATPDGRYVHVTNTGDNSVSVIDTSSNSVIATVPVGPSPFGLAATPDAQSVYALMGGNATAYVIGTATHSVTGTAVLEPGAPIAIAIAPDGRFAYIANAALGSVSVLDLAGNSLAGSITVGAFPFDVALTTDGRLAYVANMSATADAVSVIDTATRSVVASIALESGSQGVAVHPDGSRAYVTNGPANAVWVIDTATNARVAAVQVGANPIRVAVTPDGRFAYVANQDSASVSVVSTESNTVIASVPMGAIPQGVAFAMLGTPDHEAPVTSAGAAPAANAAGWNNAPVTVTLGAADNQGGSGVKSITYAVVNGANSSGGTVSAASVAFTIAAEGLNTVTYSSVDNAGNAEAPRTLAVRIDRNAPSSVASATPPADSSGRNTGPVTVSVSAADAGSGAQSISILRSNGGSTVGDTFQGAAASVVVSTQGVTTVTYQATDHAGNTEAPRTLTIRIEAAPAPAFRASVSVSPAVLWPPDRRFDSVHARVKSANAVGRVRIASVSVASDEAVGRSPDWIVKGSSVKLRAERSDRGNGRVYTLTYTLVDEAGNTAQAVDTVKVPRYWPHWYWGQWDHKRDHGRR